MATTFTTAYTYTTNNVDWATLAQEYYNFYSKDLKVSEPPMPKAPPKPPRMEFNVKAKGWVPPAKKNRMTEAQAVDYLEAKGHKLGEKFVDGFGRHYIIDMDELGYYWLEIK